MAGRQIMAEGQEAGGRWPGGHLPLEGGGRWPKARSRGVWGAEPPQKDFMEIDKQPWNRTNVVQNRFGIKSKNEMEKWNYDP